jgi:hypothetical protein
VSLGTPGLENPEAVSRLQELDPLALYILNLREDGIPHQPVYFNTRATGQHGFPQKGASPAIILIRDPIATLYSFYRVARDRWNEPIGDPVAWVRVKLARYAEFYDAGLALLAANPGSSLLVRYEDLRRGPEPLHRVVSFVGVRPKLSPELVHHITRFERFVRKEPAVGPRTFYRAGDDDAWRADDEWRGILDRSALPDLSRFGPTATDTRTSV